MKLTDIIQEVAFSVYQTHIRIKHHPDTNVQDIGEMLRAVPGVLTIVQIDHNYEEKQAIMKVKILTTKPVKEAFQKFIANTYKMIPAVKKIEIDYNGIEKKK